MSRHTLVLRFPTAAFFSAGMQYLLCLLLGLGAFATASAGSVNWEIRSRFRAFDYLPVPADTPTDLRADYWFRRLAPAAGETDALAWVKRVVSSSGGSPYGESNTGPWDETRNSYSSDFVELPHLVPITANLTDTADSPLLSTQTCEWRMNGRVAATAPCLETVRIDDLPREGATLEAFANGASVAKVEVHPRLRIVLGLGDSYGAGEGSPDVPTVWKPAAKNARWSRNLVWEVSSHVKDPAQWLSNRCNRSFYSFEDMAALQMAAKDPHSIIAFAHFACAGAEVVDGMLSPEREPPGHTIDCKSPEKRADKGLAPMAGCDVPQSQITAVVTLLCDDQRDIVPLDAATVSQIEEPLVNLHYAHDQLNRINELVRCRGEMRAVDTVLLSMGGNDMGFGGVIATVLLPKGYNSPVERFLVEMGHKEAGAVCVKGLKCIDRTRPTAEERLAELPQRYAALATAFNKLIGVSDASIVLAEYPDPLYDSAGKLCGDVPVSRPKDHNNAWWAIRTSIPVNIFGRIQIDFTREKAAVVDSEVIEALDDTLDKTAQPPLNWRVAQVRDAFASHGWCVGDTPVQRLPSPADVHTWSAYAAHGPDPGRFIRTIDDSFMTQQPGHGKRRDGLSGSFHPDAYGYAAVANGVEQVLDSKPGEGR